MDQNQAVSQSLCPELVQHSIDEKAAVGALALLERSAASRVRVRVTARVRVGFLGVRTVALTSKVRRK